MTVSIDSAPPRTGTGRLVIVLGGLSAVSPFAIDMYAPGFPEIVTSLGTSRTSVQLSLTACLFGLAVGQIVLGPVSDAVGRRRLLLAGSGMFTVFSLVCALAPSIAVFDVARLLQGIAGSAGIVIGRAVISDQSTGTRAARQLTTLSVIGSTAPVLAPVVGGLILGVGSWRLVFVALAVTGLLLVTAIWAWVPESLPVERRRAGGLRAALAAMGGLLRRREMVGYLFVMGCGLAALFAYISGSPFVFQGVYGLSPIGYGLVFATNAVGTVAAGAMFGWLAGRVRLNSLLAIGVVITVASLITLATLLVIGISTFPTTWACLFGFTFGFGLLLPASTTIILAVGSDAPGAASGMLGGAQFVLGAVAAPLPGVLGNTTAMSTAVVVLGFVLLAAVALITLARPWQGHGEPAGQP
ncbi:Bcr/CflA family drug resistance efflux transporter [Streptomyces albospinus]|uniref:Bcr/CflA family drug resistance efflux transporter n=1 Tax=Streptomyces albospinus TaxID=285515 RepID=A0ABQ2UQ50_9ACTN|nr:multidrug effflux MFS transporter [Streptomyces albospinus]GGU47458.1 Bcr/CflA family drug resistance efflux transporter [Streptomyces albospinus]